MHVAVTGGSGFIGASLVDRLVADGHTVRLLTRSTSKISEKCHPQLTYVQGDLRDESADLNGFLSDADTLFHCAGEIQQESQMASLHVEGTQRLASAARGKIKHWVQLSSVGAYGPHHLGEITEKTAQHPRGTYEITKTQSDRLVMDAAQDGAFKLSILRPANVIGTTMPNQSVYQMISAIDRGLFAYIGKAGAMTNYVPVENVVEALILCATRHADTPEIFNLSDPLPLEEFIKAICTGLEKKDSIQRIPEPLARAAAFMLGWLPRFPLTQARIDALTSRTIYSPTKISAWLGYNSKTHVADCAQAMARDWKKQHGKS